MKIILVSAGHSNIDPGVTRGALREADFTLLLRNLISRRLKYMGVPHITDGSDGVNFSLPYAMQLEKTVNGTKLEIHLNGGLLDMAQGTEALSLAEHKIEAKKLALVTSQVLGTPLRGQSGWKDQSKAGPHSRLGFCMMGGIILEVCFLTNAAEMKKLEARIDNLAEKLADTLMELNKE